MGQSDLDPSEISELFKILSNPVRVQIILFLNAGPMSYKTLYIRLGEPPTGTLNFHLKKLTPLLKKGDDFYELNTVGKKAVVLIESYSQELPPDQVIRKKRNPKNDFFRVGEEFIPLISFLVFGIPLMFLPFGSLGATYFILVITSAIGTRFVMEKIYESENSLGTTFFGLVSGILAFILYFAVVVGVSSDLFFTIMNNVLNTEVNVESTIYSGTIAIPSEVSLSWLLSIYPIPYDILTPIYATIVGAVSGILSARYSYGEFPSFEGLVRESKDGMPKVEHVSKQTYSFASLMIFSLVFLLSTAFVLFITMLIGGYLLLLIGINPSFLFVKFWTKLIGITVIGIAQFFTIKWLTRGKGLGSSMNLKFSLFVVLPTLIAEVSFILYLQKITFSISSDELIESSPGTFEPFYQLIRGYDVPNMEFMLMFKTAVLFLVLYSFKIRETGRHYPFQIHNFIELSLISFSIFLVLPVPQMSLAPIVVVLLGLAINKILSERPFTYGGRWLLLLWTIGVAALTILFAINYLPKFPYLVLSGVEVAYNGWTKLHGN